MRHNHPSPLEHKHLHNATSPFKRPKNVIKQAR